MQTRLCSLSANTTARGKRCIGQCRDMVALPVDPGPFDPEIVGLDLGAMPDDFGHVSSKSKGYLRQRRRRILHDVVKQAGDHDVLVKPRPIEDDRDRDDVGDVGRVVPAPSLASMALGGPAQRLFKAWRDQWRAHESIREIRG